MFRSLFGASRFLILLAVFGAFLAATTLLVYGFVQTVQLILRTIEYGAVSRKAAKDLSLELIEIIDLFLIGTVFYIVALGLYELFIDSKLTLPRWMTIRTLDDLKDKLIGVVVVVLAVFFLGQVVTWTGETDIQSLGIAIAVMIAALTWFLSAKPRKTAKDDDPTTDKTQGTR